MLHLALSSDLLIAVGAGPHFERANFPILARWYPCGVHERAAATAPTGSV